MGNRITGLAAALLLVATHSLGAQYVAHLVITGGSHAGKYEMLRPNSCALIGGSRVFLTDASAPGHNDRVAALTLDPATFTIVFGSEVSSGLTDVRYVKSDQTNLTGEGKLTLTFQYGKETFTGVFSGMTINRSDTVRISGTLGCKAAKVE